MKISLLVKYNWVPLKQLHFIPFFNNSRKQRKGSFTAKGQTNFNNEVLNFCNLTLTVLQTPFPAISCWAFKMYVVQRGHEIYVMIFQTKKSYIKVKQTNSQYYQSHDILLWVALV